MQMLYICLQGAVFGWTLGGNYELKNPKTWMFIILNTTFISLIVGSN